MIISRPNLSTFISARGSVALPKKRLNGGAVITVKPVFHLTTLFTRRENKNRHRDWLKLTGEKIRREQVGTVPTFFSVRTNKFDKWKNRQHYRLFSTERKKFK